MSDRKVVIFETTDVAAEERLIREYIVPAFRRLDDRTDVHWLIFNRYGHDPSVTGGEVTFYIFGDVETITAEERERWDALVDNGFADEWWTDDTEIHIEEFDKREHLRYRMRAAASRMTVEFYEEFDELPDSIDEFDGESRRSVGWWNCLHHIINQLGYQAGDGEEEIDLLFELLRSRLYRLAVAPGVGPEEAEAKADRLSAELGSLPSDLYEFREKHGAHEHTYANRETFKNE